MSYEKSLVLLKPDSLKKRLVGRIISRFEDAGLDILQIQFVERASESLISDHYQSTDEWLIGVGNKTLSSYETAGKSGDDVVQEFGSLDPKDIGMRVKERLIRFMTSGPVIAIVFGGNHAIKKIRTLAGYTIPAEAVPGTIRGDFSLDSPDYATAEDRAVENLVHASGNRDEADYEIRIWFGDL